MKIFMILICLFCIQSIYALYEDPSEIFDRYHTSHNNYTLKYNPIIEVEDEAHNKFKCIVTDNKKLYRLIDDYRYPSFDDKLVYYNILFNAYYVYTEKDIKALYSNIFKHIQILYLRNMIKCIDSNLDDVYLINTTNSSTERDTTQNTTESILKSESNLQNTTESIIQNTTESIIQNTTESIIQNTTESIPKSESNLQNITESIPKSERTRQSTTESTSTISRIIMPEKPYNNYILNYNPIIYNKYNGDQCRITNNRKMYMLMKPHNSIVLNNLTNIFFNKNYIYTKNEISNVFTQVSKTLSKDEFNMIVRCIKTEFYILSILNIFFSYVCILVLIVVYMKKVLFK